MADLVVLEFLKAGLQTSIQDLGRPGWQAYGVPIGGAMDRLSLVVANRLVGNPPDGPCLEITLLGPTIKVHGRGRMALVGADLSATLNHQLLQVARTFPVENGDVLRFGQPRVGCRVYLAVAGDWQITKWLGSYSEIPYSRSIKGIKPLPIDVGREILVSNRNQPRLADEVLTASPTNAGPIRVIAGPEASLFTKDHLEELAGRAFFISSQSNRMGYRLEPSLQNFQPLPELISSGIVPGTIQITRSGQPIILMADAQTTGGYHRIANVVLDDLPRLAQMRPGDPVRFTWIN